MDEHDYGNQVSAIERGVSLKRPTESQSLFKYVSLANNTSWKYFEETISEGILRGSTAKSLNDPFELEPCIVDDLRPSVIENVLGTSTGAFSKRANLAKKLQRSVTTNDVARAEKENNEKYMNVEIHSSVARSYLEKVKKYNRIISFCQRSDSSLLWAHYANSYQGACFQFLGGAFRRVPASLGYVEYSDFRPMYPLSLALKLEAGAEARGRLGLERKESDKIHFFTKASEWSYEKEVRIVYNSNVLKKVKFDTAGLVSVILGPRMSSEDKGRVREVVANSPFPNLRIHEAVLSKTAFSVEAFSES